MNRILLLVAVFSFGYVVNDIVHQKSPSIFPSVQAQDSIEEIMERIYKEFDREEREKEIANYESSLGLDYEFKQKVRYIIENYCSVGEYSRISC